MKDSKKERKQKKVKQAMSLGAFVAAGKKEPEIIDLPTGPRQRSEHEEAKKGGLGGGFKNYGGDRGGGFDRRDRDEEGGFGDREEEGPSRADAADDWGTKKAFVPSTGPSRGGGGGFSDRGGGFGDRDGAEKERGGFGDRYSERRSGFGEGDLDRADNADKWGSKTFEPSAGAPSSTSSRRGGFEDREKSSFGSRDLDDGGGPSRADTEDRWSRRSPPAETLETRPRGQSGGSRPRLALKPRSAALPPLARAPSATPSATPSVAASETSEDPKDKELPVARSGPKPNPFGSAKPVDVKEKAEPSPRVELPVRQASGDCLPEKKVTPPKPRSNPFGAARPREEVLKEKEATSSKAASAAGSEKGDAAVSPPPSAADAQEETTKAPKTEDSKESEAEALEEPTTETVKESRVEAASGSESKVQEVSKQLQNGVSLNGAESSGAETASKAPPAPEVKAGGSWAKIAAPKAEEVTAE